MYKSLIVAGILVATLGTGIVTMLRSTQPEERPCYNQLSEIEDLFPRSAQEVEIRIQRAADRLKKDIDTLMSQDRSVLSFDSTFAALDRAMERFNIDHAAIYAVSSVTTDDEVRAAAHKLMPEMTPLLLDMVSLNKELYAVLKEYAEKNEPVTEKQRYFMEETLRGFERSGLSLPLEQQKRLRALQQEQTQLIYQFNQHIASSNPSITVNKDGLQGLEDSFIKTLKQTESGDYRIPTDYAHFFKVMEQSEVADTRKRLHQTFYRRAYPENESVLKRLIAVSDEIAQLLGSKSFAHYMIEEEMAKSPERVTTFLHEIKDRVWQKAEQEFEQLKNDLPEGVSLHDGKFYPWDLTFVVDRYKKKRFAINEAILAEYFPLDHTLPALLRIYEDFFGIRFKKLTQTSFWHDEVELYAVYKDARYQGVIILDMFPRPHKFSHGGHLSVVPAVTSSGKLLPSVSLVMVNFPRPHEERPSLLKRNDVKTFFHEFGHALHALLGATELASVAGTSVKFDFAEMPSQMLEEWLWDPAILKRISSHYKTNEPLPDDLIANIRALKGFGKGISTLSQVFLASLSLVYYQPGADKDVLKIMQDLQKEFSIGQFRDDEDRSFASFTHLAGYGPRYYGYLWSKVFALDLFSVIEPLGLTNSTIGAKYVDTILAQGGSKEPAQLLTDFLGREPSAEAFFNDIGV